MKKDNFDKIFNKISKYYDERILKYDDSPKSVGQKNIKTLERLSILLEVGDLKIQNIGFWLWHRLSLRILKKINYQGVYVGYDISSEMIKLARKKYKTARFENKDIFHNRINEKFDYVLINGTFNYKFNNNFKLDKKNINNSF